MDAKLRHTIIVYYGRILQNRKYNFAKESELSHPKGLIRQALAEELLFTSHDGEERKPLETAFTELESFVPEKHFEKLRAMEQVVLKAKKIVPKESLESGPLKKSQVDLLVEAVAKTPFYEDIHKNIMEKMAWRLKQIQAINMLSDIWRN